MHGTAGRNAVHSGFQYYHEDDCSDHNKAYSWSDCRKCSFICRSFLTHSVRHWDIVRLHDQPGGSAHLLRPQRNSEPSVALTAQWTSRYRNPAVCSLWTLYITWGTNYFCQRQICGQVGSGHTPLILLTDITEEKKAVGQTETLRSIEDAENFPAP